MLKQEIIDAYVAGKIIHWSNQSGGRCVFQYQGVDYYADIYTRYLITKRGPWCFSSQGYVDNLRSKNNNWVEADVEVYDTLDDFALSVYKHLQVKLERAAELMRLGFEVELIDSGKRFYIPKKFRDTKLFKLYTIDDIEVTSIPIFPSKKITSVFGHWYAVGWAKDYKPFDMSLVPFISIDSEEKHNAAMKKRL